MYYYLSDGKNYVMENPYKIGEFLITTNIGSAKKFTYKQARGLKKRKGKAFTKFHEFDLVGVDTDEKEDINLYQKGNGGVYIGNKDFEFDYALIDKVKDETKSLLGLAGWNTVQLNTYRNELTNELSKCDSAESDIKHAMQAYIKNNNGRKPQAHKMAKLGYLLEDIRLEREDVKLCIRYIDVMRDAIKERYTIERLKLELSRVENREYKGRTKYWDIANNILES